MRFVYKRRLILTEVKRHYIFVDTEHREMFPSPEDSFKIIVDHDRVLEAKIDSEGRIYSRLWKYITLEEGDTIVFARKRNGSFNVSVKK